MLATDVGLQCSRSCCWVAAAAAVRRLSVPCFCAGVPAVDGITYYMGKDKEENELLLQYGWPEDVWCVDARSTFSWRRLHCAFVEAFARARESVGCGLVSLPRGGRDFSAVVMCGSTTGGVFQRRLCARL